MPLSRHKQNVYFLMMRLLYCMAAFLLGCSLLHTTILILKIMNDCKGCTSVLQQVVHEF